MNDDRILAIQVEHADLQQRAVAGRADEHGQVIVMSIFLMAVRTACQMPASPTPCLRARTDPHRGSLSFRAYPVNNCCLLITSRFVHRIRQPGNC